MLPFDPDEVIHDEGVLTFDGRAMPPLSREELLVALRSLDGDPEMDHREADRLLLAYIQDREVTAAFERIRRWYA